MDDIVVEETYPYSPDQVWEALTDPAAVADWLMPGDFKAAVGHKVRLRCEPKGAFDGVVDVEVLVAERPHKLSYSWKTSGMDDATIVTFTLTHVPGGTRLRLEHTGFGGAAGPVLYELFKGGWADKLKEQLRAVIGRLAPGP